MAEDLPQTLIDMLESKGKFCSSNPSRNLLWRKVMEAHIKRKWLGSWRQKVNNVHGIRGSGHQYSVVQVTKTKKINRCTRNVLKMMKRRSRRARDEGPRRETRIERKVRTLKKLIPNGESSMGLDGLFRDTAEYILSLQMRVRLMQTMVDALASGCDE